MSEEINLLDRSTIPSYVKITDEERQLVRQHIDQAPDKASLLTPKERTQRLNAALDAMGDGLSQVQLDEMTAAMTEEYIEAWDDSDGLPHRIAETTRIHALWFMGRDANPLPKHRV